MSNLLKVGPLRFAALAVAALALGAGCDDKPSAQAPTVPASHPVASPPPATGVLGPAEEPAGGTRPPSGQSRSGGSGGSGSSAVGRWLTAQAARARPRSGPARRTASRTTRTTSTLAYDAGVYTVKDGSKLVVRVYGSQGDEVGDKALALAQRYRKHCYLGRDNGREDEASYVFDYWRDASGLKPTIPGQEDDCSVLRPHRPDRRRHGQRPRVAGPRERPRAAHLRQRVRRPAGKLVLAKYGQICFIGDSGDDEQDVVNYML